MTSDIKDDITDVRFKEKFITVLNVALYEKFINTFPKYKHITFLEFKKIIHTFNVNLMEGMIDNRDGIELPESLGFIFIGTCDPPKGRTHIDFNTYNKTGIKSLHKNWSSDNNLLKIFYTCYPVKNRFQHGQLWAFKPSKVVRHKASVAYKQNWTKYIKVDSGIQVSTLLDTKLTRKHIPEVQVIPEEYDEFKM